jgi:hypothetical protein
MVFDTKIFDIQEILVTRLFFRKFITKTELKKN